VIQIDVQIHGYRKGHQLLASSIVLSKEDQAVIDRLSDVAGPLRPKEEFSPYLSAYPLPSGTYYVIAMTWQDLSVSRAGCVRTKSLLINSQIWSVTSQILPIVRKLDSSELPTEADAIRIELEEQLEVPLKIASTFNASELLEALFLEDPNPVVVFDAPEPEKIALHLLTALWPDIRKRFTLCTFALSPRKIGGRDLDLIFAPANARAKFSDWVGRRVDGRTAQMERHRWTRPLVNRVFEGPFPRLLTIGDVALLGERDTGSSTALRIVLLWDELIQKLELTPTAVLGLLDIANSGMVNSDEALKLLDSRIIGALHKVEGSMPPEDAWIFINALVRKIQRYEMHDNKKAIASLVVHLVEQDPSGIFGLLEEPEIDVSIINLLPSIAIGLSHGSEDIVKNVLLKLRPDTMAHLISESSALVRLVASDDELIEKLRHSLPKLAHELSDKIVTMLLPYLVEDRQLNVASKIFEKLDSQEVAEQLDRIGKINNFEAKLLCNLLINRARKINELQPIRNSIMLSSPSSGVLELLEMTIDPVHADLQWLLNENRLSKSQSNSLIVGALKRANEAQFAELITDTDLGKRLVERIPDEETDILTRAALHDLLPLNVQIRVVKSILPRITPSHKSDIANRILLRCLSKSFDGDEVSFISMLLGVIGEQLDSKLIIAEGLKRNIASDIASRNLTAFEHSPNSARLKFVGAVSDIALALQKRFTLDLTEKAYDAYALLMFDAEKLSALRELIRAATILVPELLNARNKPVSLLIASSFPVLYNELAKSNEVPDLTKFFFFFDWDRCKTARNELVKAFMSSSWKAGDLALTGCRCGDLSKILGQVAKSYQGIKYLTRIENDLTRLAPANQLAVKAVITELLADKSSNFNF
jgi:hypothetical protein